LHRADIRRSPILRRLAGKRLPSAQHLPALNLIFSLIFKFFTEILHIKHLVHLNRVFIKNLKPLHVSVHIISFAKSTINGIIVEF